MQSLAKEIYLNHVESYAMAKGYGIENNCRLDITNSISNCLSYHAARLGIEKDELGEFELKDPSLTDVAINCHECVDRMIVVVSQKTNEKMLFEWSFLQVKSFLCPIFPFC